MIRFYNNRIKSSLMIRKLLIRFMAEIVSKTLILSNHDKRNRRFDIVYVQKFFDVEDVTQC